MDNIDLIYWKNDRSNSIVILNQTYYSRKKDSVKRDSSKFQRLTKVPSGNVMKKLNDVVENINDI